MGRITGLENLNVGEIPPLNPKRGDFWINPDEQKFYIFTDNEWVEISSSIDIEKDELEKIKLKKLFDIL